MNGFGDNLWLKVVFFVRKHTHMRRKVAVDLHEYISRVNDWRYATRDMEEPQTAESWRTMPLKAAEWWKKVEAGEIENPYVFEHSNEPEDYEF